MKGVDCMFILGLLILVIGIFLVAYVKDNSFSYYDQYGYPCWREIKTKPYLLEGAVMIGCGAVLCLVWVFIYEPKKQD
jgi:hypothetical protein